MLSKEDVLKNFSAEEREDVIKIYDYMSLASSKNITVFTKFFYTPNIWVYFIKNFNSKNLKVEAVGGYDECERRLLSFNNIYNESYPYKMIKILNKSKFTTLNHRDYLGALMSLGIERGKLGDLRVVENYAVVPVYDELVDYLLSGLEFVGKSPVEISFINEYDLPKFDSVEEIIIIPSLRIDNFISKLAKVSRGKALDLINSNKILVDYSKVKEKSQEIAQGQTITISRVGKFIVGDIVGNTKSGRYRINIKKYV
jgi:RNA-binding protein YlmH